MYILNYHDLQMGDIILDRDDSKQSKVIRWSCKSNYSHARIYVGGTIIESEGLGVQSVNPQRILYKDKADAIVIRTDATSEQKLAACIYARSECGKEYSAKDGKQKVVNEPNRQFCTRLIAMAYHYAGYDIIDKDPMLCTPKDLEEYNKDCIIPDMLHEASEEELSIAQSEGLLKMEGECNDQALIFSDLLQCLRLSTDDNGCDIQNETQIMEYLIMHPENDSMFSSIIMSHRYFTMWQEYERANPWEFDFSLFIKHFGENSVNAAKYLLDNSRGIDVLWNYQCESYRDLYYQYGFLTLNTMLELYVSLLAWHKKRIEVFSSVIAQLTQ